MTVCAIGGRPVEIVRRVFTTTHPEGIAACQAHALAYEFADRLANALLDLLGDDDPYVELAYTALDDLLNEPCPQQEAPSVEVGELPPRSDIPPCPGLVA